MFKWIRFLITDESNQWDIGILFWIAGCILYLYRGVTAPWDFQSFGIGLMGVLGAGAGLQWVKQQNNPQPSVTTELKQITIEHKKDECVDHEQR